MSPALNTETLGFHASLNYLRARRLSAVASENAPDPSCKKLPPGIEIKHNPELTFAPADLQRVRSDPEGQTRLTASFLGLSGASSPMPDYLLEELSCTHEQDLPIQDYLNLFHHRLYELLFFGVAQKDLAGQLCQNSSQIWMERIGHLVGLNLRRLPIKLPLPTLFALCPYLMVAKPNRDVVQGALRAALGTFFADPARQTLHVEDLCGDTSALHPSFQNRLGQARHRLGHDCVLGERVQDPCARARVRVGVLYSDETHHWKPGSLAERTLCCVLSLLVHEPLHIELALEVRDRGHASNQLNLATLGCSAQLGQANAPSTYTLRRSVRGTAPL